MQEAVVGLVSNLDLKDLTDKILYVVTFSDQSTSMHREMAKRRDMFAAGLLHMLLDQRGLVGFF